MRFVSLVKRILGKTRPAQSQSASMGDLGQDANSDADVPMQEVVRALRQLSRRLSKLEALSPAEPTEFEVVVGTAGSLTELYHGYKGPVRWWVTTWMQQPDFGASPTTAPVLVRDTSSTSNSLFLKSYVAGRAVIRVEPSNYDMDP